MLNFFIGLMQLALLVAIFLLFVGSWLAIGWLLTALAKRWKWYDEDGPYDIFIPLGTMAGPFLPIFWLAFYIWKNTVDRAHEYIASGKSFKRAIKKPFVPKSPPVVIQDVELLPASKKKDYTR